MAKVVVLYSGGLDSFVLYHYAKSKGHDVMAVYYAHGAEAEEAEIAALPDFVDVRKIDWLNVYDNAVTREEFKEYGRCYIPGRNMVFAVNAACQYLPDEIWMGSLVDELEGRDRSREFIRRTNYLLEYVLGGLGVKPTVEVPFADAGWYKSDMIRWALDNGITEEELNRTVSCWYAKDNKPCGKCFQCLRRYYLFKNAGLNPGYNPLEDDDMRAVVRNVLNGSAKDKEYYDLMLKEISQDEETMRLYKDGQL